MIDAVGASCAVPGIWPPVTIDGKRSIDGGMRSASNADLAAGYRRVLIIAPLTQGFGPIASVASQIQQLTAQGSEVILIKPDKAALLAIGKTCWIRLRPGAAKAGYEQGLAEASAVAALWSTAAKDQPVEGQPVEGQPAEGEPATTASRGSGLRRAVSDKTANSEPGPAGGRARLAAGSGC